MQKVCTGKDILRACRNVLQSQLDIITRDGGMFDENCCNYSYKTCSESFSFIMSEVRDTHTCFGRNDCRRSTWNFVNISLSFRLMYGAARMVVPASLFLTRFLARLSQCFFQNYHVSVHPLSDSFANIPTNICSLVLVCTNCGTCQDRGNASVLNVACLTLYEMLQTTRRSKKCK